MYCFGVIDYVKNCCFLLALVTLMCDIIGTSGGDV